MFGMEYGLLGLVYLVLFLFTAIHTLGSREPPMVKALWIGALIVLPLAGFLAWFFLGPRSTTR